MVDLAALTDALAERYRILRPLGSGGMATVHLAEDLRHGRLVALKLMHPELAAAVGAGRFLSEIRTTANLQHPHILPLFDSGEVLGTVYYVMPYVEGETLRDRLRRETQLPVGEAIAIARQVGEALQYAHLQGVIHRDIKPENILLRGQDAFVSDFGIALAIAQTGGRRMTETGLSIGTPAYMSPEQAMGDRSITVRSDVYALGCVVYEMLTGALPFDGPSAQAVMARVLTESPTPIRRLRERVPPAVEAAVLTAIEKLPADRFASAGEFVQALTAAATAGAISGEVAVGVAAPSGVRSGLRHPAAVASVAAIPALLLGLWLGGARTAPREPMRLGLRSENSRGVTPAVVVGAPDGRSFLQCTPSGGLALQRWADARPTPLPVLSTGCSAAAFSPDGQWLALLGIPTALYIVSVQGDAPTRSVAVEGLDDIAVYGGALDWADDGQLYVASRLGLDRISPTDGRRARLPTPAGHTLFGFDALPGPGRALVVFAATGATNPDASQVGLLDLASGRIDSLMPGVIARGVGKDAAVVVRADGAMLLVDITSGARGAAPRTRVLPDSVGTFDAVGFRQPLVDVARDGTLLYWRSSISGENRPVLVDERGVEEQLATDWRAAHTIPRLSRDGTRLAAEVFDGAVTRLVIRNLRTGGTERPELPGVLNGRPSWARTSDDVVFISDRDGVARAYLRGADGAVRAIATSERRPVFHAEYSRDGRWLLLRTDDQAPGRADILALAAGDSIARPIVADPSLAEYSPTLSPDGRWLAYVSNEGGRFDVRVTEFPDARERWTLSSGGGTEPAWSPDGRRLYYIAAGGRLVEATLSVDDGVRVVARRELFSLDPYVLYGEWNRNYDITPDGRRFLFLRRVEATSSDLVIVRDWLPEARRSLRR